MTETSHSPHRPSVARIYRTGTIIFLSISVVVGAAIAWLTFSRTSITVTIVDRELSTETNLATEPQPAAGSQAIRGVVATATAEDTITVAVPSEGTPVDDYARGQVTIVNHWTKAQPLAAGTRLKSETNGLIYRTTKRVDVPSGGQIDVEIVCDVKGQSGNVEPNRFTIVALWAGLQKDIYAENTVALTGGTRASGVLTQTLIDQSAQQLLTSLTTAANQKIVEPPAGLEYYGVPTVTASGTTADTKPGREVASFKIRGSVTVSAVAVDPGVIRQRATAALGEKLNSGEQTIGEIRLDLKVKSIKDETAVITLTTTVRARLSDAAEALAPSRLTGKTKDEITSVLRAIPGVSDVVIDISPFWATRTPNLVGNIRVVTKTAGQ